MSAMNMTYPIAGKRRWFEAASDGTVTIKCRIESGWSEEIRFANRDAAAKGLREWRRNGGSSGYGLCRFGVNYGDANSRAWFAVKEKYGRHRYWHIPLVPKAFCAFDAPREWDLWRVIGYWIEMAHEFAPDVVDFANIREVGK